MNLLRGMFSRDEDPPSSQSAQPPRPTSRSSRYNSHNHGWNSTNSNSTSSNGRYDYRTNHPDLYLSDDDDWGMSTTNPSYDRRAFGGGGYGGDEASSRKHNQIFWDQEIASMRGGSPGEGGGWDGEGGGGGSSSLGSGSAGGSVGSGSGGSRAGGRGTVDGHADVDGEGVPRSTSSEKYMQEWEREARMRDGLDSAFEIGNDDYYHSERRPVDGDGDGAPYHGDLAHPDEEDEEDDDESKEEVVNAYRDYLKSIREGGFESYLNDDVEDDTPDFEELARTDEIAKSGGTDLPRGDVGNRHSHRHPSNTPSSSSSRNAQHSRVMEIEEERRGTFYGDLYGVRDVRSSRSPYAMWKARAKMNHPRYDEEGVRDDGSLSSWMNYDPNDTAFSKGWLRRTWSDLASKGPFHCKLPFSCSDHPKLQKWCTVLMVVLALALGLSVYAKGEEDKRTSPDVFSIPPKDEGAPVGTETSSTQNGPTPKPPNKNGPPDAIANALRTFDPIWFNRQGGWEGITFTDAVNFCSSHDQRVPCPYEIYCNRGPNQDPYDGIRPNGEQWAAVSNGPNQWVQVGDMFTCQRYTDLHDKKKPEWGITGVSFEHEHGAGGITQNILCCHNANHLGPVTEWGKEDAIENAEEDSTFETTNTTTMQLEDAQQEKDVTASGGNVAVVSNDVNGQKREKAVIAAFQPIWFSSAHGWSGGSYEDGVEFCESYNHMVLCPFAAYCPNGPGQTPLPGSMVVDLDGEEWVPANGPMNTWVQVGKIDGDTDTTCTLYHELYGQRPGWGIDGSMQDLKHHIMCCLM